MPGAFAVTSPVESAAARLGHGLTALAAGLAVIAILLVSNMMLARLGIEYETPGGSGLEKMHPGTYGALAALAFLIATRVDPIAFLDEVLREQKGVVVFLLLWIGLAAHIVLSIGAPVTMIVDTFLLPILLVLVLPRLSGSAAHRLALIVHAVMAANAVLGLVEFALQIRMTPLVAAGVALTGDWRSSAFLGHPLMNASVTGGYILMLLLGGGRDLPRPAQALALALQLPAMAVFGGRAAIVVMGLFGGFLAVRHLVRIVGGRRITLTGAALVATLVPLVAGVIVTLVAAGFFDRFLERFVSDDGSAQTRIGMFILLAQIPLHDLVFGPDPELVATLQRLEGLEFGIESFPVAMLAFYGGIVAAPFLLGFLVFMRDVARAGRPESWWIVNYFIVVSLTSASISGKTTALAVCVAQILLLMRSTMPAAPRERAP